MAARPARRGEPNSPGAARRDAPQRLLSSGTGGAGGCVAGGRKCRAPVGFARVSKSKGESEMNVRQANGVVGVVHVAKPQVRETYCGRAVDEEEWVTTSREANCTACARVGAPVSEGTARH